MRSYTLPTILTLAFLLCCSDRGRAAVTAQTSIPAARAAHPLPPDPAISDPEWQRGAMPAAGGFEDLTTRTVAPLATSVWMLYDSSNLYVAFRAEQAGVPIEATQSTNDVGFGTDDFAGVAVDTSGAGSHVYFFEVTPRGVRYEQASENARYRPHWQAVARVSGSSWSAVLIIPLRVMRIHPGSPQMWRINFIRSVAATGEHYTWAYDGLMQDGTVGHDWPTFRDARFWAAWSGILVNASLLKAARPQPRLEIYGLESAGRDRDVFQQAGGSFAPQSVRMAGLDASYPLTPTINFVGTLNPDFSNVEIDQQTIAPQEFRRQLQEYRPFFTQGAAFIDANGDPAVPSQAFYSPSVGAFDRGEKVEGTFGDQSFGALNFRGKNAILGDTFDDTAFGYNHVLPDHSFLYWADGVLAHHTLFGSDSTTEAGMGGRDARSGFVWALDDAVEQASGLWLPTRIAHNASGFIDVHKPNYELNVAEVAVSPFYNPIDGFTQNSDISGPQAFAFASGATPFVRNYALNLFVDRFRDRSGEAHQADFDLFFNASFKNKFSIDGAGTANSYLRSYVVDPSYAGGSCNDPALARSYFTGYPRYACGRNDAFDLATIPIGYGDGTPTPLDASVSFGRFGHGLLGAGDNGQDYVHLYTIAFSRPLARAFSIGFEYDGTFERAMQSGAAGSQWLRRLSIGAQLDRNSNLTISLRGINGNGGFALPGLNLAGAYHRRFASGDLFVNFGTPAAPYTLDRTIVKYVFRLSGDSGT